MVCSVVQRTRHLIALCGVAFQLALWSQPAGAHNLSRFLETQGAEFGGIVQGPDKAMWFVSSGYNGNGYVGRIAADGTITNYPFGSESGANLTISAARLFDLTSNITVGPDGALWFSEQVTNTGRIGRITVDGALTEFSIPWTAAIPAGITVGPDGALWFSDATSPIIGRVTTAGNFTQFFVSENYASLASIATGSDGALWYTDYWNGLIGRLTTSGETTTFTLPANVTPQVIAAGPDGALWYTDENGSIGRITTSGVNTMYPVPLLPQPDNIVTGPSPNYITLGPDGAMWFADTGSGDIGRIDMSGTITQFAAYDRVANQAWDGFIGIAWGADGNLWLTDDILLDNDSGYSIARVVSGPTFGPIFSATLPSMRSVEVGSDATFFAAIVNSGGSTVHGCSIQPDTTFPGPFTYQAFDTATQQLIGTTNQPVDIAAGAVQSFVLSVDTTETLDIENLFIGYYCLDADEPLGIKGLNAVFLSVSPTPVPDIVAIAVTPSNDGIVHLPVASGSGVFSVASVNLGIGATIQAKIGDLDGSIIDTVPVQVTLCQTDTQTGQCLTSPGQSITATIAQNGTASFAAFVSKYYGTIPFNPIDNRIYVTFFDATGERGATSITVTTD